MLNDFIINYILNMENLVFFFVKGGAIVLLFTFFLSLRTIIILKKSEEIRNWYILTYLILFFQIGYFTMVILLALGIETPLSLMMGIIFFITALFMFSLVYLLKKMIVQLLASRVALLKQTGQLREVNMAFERFVPKEFLMQLGRENILDVRLGDQSEEYMSIMFSDIRSFSTLSEGMSTKESFEFINRYLNYISPVIYVHSGFIDKFLGDGLMALFPKKPVDSINSAIHIFEVLKAFNEEVNRGEKITIGVSIHTGKIMLGTIGGVGRMEGTVISDAVNIASRIEGLNKRFGTGILVTQEVYDETHGEPFYFRHLGRTFVRGRKEKVSLFEVYNIDDEEQIELKTQTLRKFAAGIYHYENKNISKAKEIFSKILEINPNDKPAHSYIRHCNLSL